MSEHLEIQRLSQKLMNPEQTKNDLNDAMTLVADMFRERYINRMSESLYRMKERSMKEPPKEVALLRSLKPFMVQSSHEKIDKMVDALILVDTLGKLRADGSNAVHEDGVYEMDLDCLAEKGNK